MKRKNFFEFSAVSYPSLAHNLLDITSVIFQFVAIFIPKLESKFEAYLVQVYGFESVEVRGERIVVNRRVFFVYELNSLQKCIGQCR